MSLIKPKVSYLFDWVPHIYQGSNVTELKSYSTINTEIHV